MQKVVGVVGYKNSGKTSLVRELARELAARGVRLAVVKHTSHPLDLPDKDTALLGQAVEQVACVSPQESMVFWKKPLSLEAVAAFLEAEIILLEGFKSQKTFPKIACLRGVPDDRELIDGLVVAAVGRADHVADATFPVLAIDAIGQLADLVEERGFKLPNLNCGGCGHDTCYEMAREIVAGRANVEQCTSLHPATEVRIDGQLLPMNSFIAGIVGSTILGLLSPLRGFKKGKIEITL